MTPRRGVLVLCPSQRDHREIARLKRAPEYTFFFHDYDASIDNGESCPPFDLPLADPEPEIERIVNGYAGKGIAAVVSSDDYPGSALAAIVAERLGLPGPAPSVNLLCQHKYHSRQAQRAVIPQSVPHFDILDPKPGAALPPGMQLPFFIKPIKSFFSVGAQPVYRLDELDLAKLRASLPEIFFRPLKALIAKYTSLSWDDSTLLAESLLQGMQTTVEGYAYQGEINVLGVVDSIFYPGTLSFQRFEYPSSLPQTAQQRMTDIAKKMMSRIGFDNGLFNIEFMYDPNSEAIHVIEINPRMSPQFCDLFEKVDGTNTYQVLLDIAAGIKPAIAVKSGPHAMAASCALRIFEDKRVIRSPSLAEIEQLERSCPGVRVEVFAREGARLSDDVQDGHSYCYGIVSIGGKNRQDILNVLNDCVGNLAFVFTAA